MRAAELNIPGVSWRPVTAHPNRGATVQVGGKPRYRVCIPVLNIIFADEASRERTPAEQAADLREEFTRTRLFYRESSYGAFEFVFKLRTAILDRPRSWRGNAEGLQIRFARDGRLLDGGAFPEAEKYTGLQGFVVPLRQDGGDTWHENYNAKAERNYAEAALKAALEQDHPWDDPETFDEWLDAGVPKGTTAATIVFCSRSIDGGGARRFETYLRKLQPGGHPTKPMPLEFRGRKLLEYVFMDSEPPFVLAHELGHTLGAPDLYLRGLTPCRCSVETLHAEGFLGSLSIMGHHWDGSHLDAFLKFRFGWLDPVVVDAATAKRTFRLGPVASSERNALLVRPDAEDHPGEFFLLEVRRPDAKRWDGQPTAFDQKLAATQQGLVIYRIHADGPTGAGSAAEVAAARPRVDVVGEAPGSPDLVAFQPGQTYGPADSVHYDGTWRGLTIRVVRAHADGGVDVEVGWQGVGKVFTTDGAGGVQLFRVNPGWRRTWTHLVPGAYGGSPRTDLLLYDASAGEASFFASDGKGGLLALKHHTGWRRSWSQIVPGRFTADGRTSLLLYDATTGEGTFQATDGAGGVQVLRHHTGWRKTWAILVAGDFTAASTDDLLFYDRAAGEATFFATDGQGGVSTLRHHTGWRKTWSHIVPGRYGGSARAGLLLYDAGAGEASFFTSDGSGGIQLLRHHTGWRKTWTHVVAGDFGGDHRSDLMLYDAQSGEAEFHTTDASGGTKLLRRHSGWRKTWSAVVPGDFDGKGRTDFLLYDRGL